MELKEKIEAANQACHEIWQQMEALKVERNKLKRGSPERRKLTRRLWELNKEKLKVAGSAICEPPSEVTSTPIQDEEFDDEDFDDEDDDP